MGQRMSLTLRRGLFLGVTAVLAPGLTSGAKAQGPCRTADSTSAALTREIARYSSALGGDDAIVRDSLRLRALPPEELRLVAEESICRRAAAAYLKELDRNLDTFSERVIVLQAADRYVILDPAYRYALNSRWPLWFVVITDAEFRRLSLF